MLFRSSVLIFDVVCIFYRKASDLKMKKIEEKIFMLIKQSSDHIDDKHLRKLSRILKKTSYFISFVHVIQELDEEERINYLSSIKSIFLSLTPYYEKREVIFQTFYVHFLRSYPFIYSENNNVIVKYLKDSTLSSSVYLRENALIALYKTGQVEYLKDVFFNMNYRNVNHHHKLITDGLLMFNGDVNCLSSMLISEFNNYNENFKIACINYFNYKRVACEEDIYKFLSSNNESKEVRIACIRYFSNIPYEKVIPLLYDFVMDDKDNWEYATVAAYALSSYKSPDTREVLVKALHSHNWYVRNNAASSLIKISRKDYIKKITNSLDDKYAKDAVNYQLHILGKEVE